LYFLKGQKARVKTLAFFLLIMNNNGKYIAYEFFRRARSGEDRFVGALPEKRKDPERITNDSIMNWAKIKIPDEFLHSQIYFIRVRL